MTIIDPDIRKAETLPSRYYTDSETFASVISSFGQNWHFAGHRSQLSAAQPIDNSLREPMLLTHVDGEIHCISNVCTHRGMLVCTERSDAKRLQCPYHGRVFGMDGQFRSMPEFEEVENFPTQDDHLPSFPLAEWKGLLFNTISATEFKSFIAAVEARVGWLPIEDFTHDSTRHREYSIDSNWALYVDNYLEGFHIPFVHGDLHEVLDYDAYSTELFDGGVLQIGIANEGEPTFNLPEGHPDFGQNIAAYYFWLYPGLMLNFYPWGLSVNLVIPEDTDKTRIVYHGFVGDSSMLGKGAGGDLDKVEAEDQFIVEGCQKGVSSVAYERGRYSPTKESGVHHFHRIMTQ
ncbi:MAG: aromatic ring-hydroxylating dioxygenase subunit alpha [Candidatus Thalassarchaeaceae archaeon]|nr:aromatic ring-hydroxylating dioxygenase subunit alpha [Candidatus Thalassarchaeaceae archaeon]